MSKKDDLSNSKLYKKTGLFSEDEVGRVDKDGKIHRKTGLFSEDEAGRIDDAGRAYEKTGLFSEDETHRVDDNGRIYRKTGWFSEDEVGRIDEDGRVYKKTGWFSEEEIGRVEKKDENSGCFLSSACLEARGLPDDCEELTILRRFRSDFVSAQQDGQQLLAQYASIAPTIVQRVAASPQRQELFERIYAELVSEAVQLIKAGRPKEALTLYRRYVVQLMKKFSVA